MTYSRKWRFVWNVAKSKNLTFTSKRTRVDRSPLFLGLDRIERVDSFKYLGVEFKANLSWRLMKERVINKAHSRLALVSRAVASGISPDAGLKL